MPLQPMLRIYFMRRFAGLELVDDAIPDETTILNFRRLLEKHELTAKLMNTINDVLENKGLLLKGGTMVDATIIHASPSTKNKDKARDIEMHQTKKGNQWYFVMKVHVGADIHSGVVHTVSVTPANVADINQLPQLLREDDRAVLGDAGYVQNEFKRAARKAGVFWGVALKARPKHKLSAGHKRRNRKMSSIRSRVEHIFRVMKCQFCYRKVRYRGLVKNAAQVFTLVGLTDLYLKRHELAA